MRYERVSYEYMTLTNNYIHSDMACEFKRLGAQRWRLVSIDNGTFYFIREIPEVGVKLPRTTGTSDGVTMVDAPKLGDGMLDRINTLFKEAGRPLSATDVKNERDDFLKRLPHHLWPDDVKKLAAICHDADRAEELEEEVDGLTIALTFHKNLNHRIQIELADLSAKLEWRPIETAPKNGTRIFVFSEDREIAEVAKFFGPGLGSERWLGDEGDELSYAPAYWMPLPEPPSALKEQEKP